MFNRIRWRLVAWTVAVVGLILLAIGISVYTILSRTLISEVDRTLASRSEQAVDNFVAVLSGESRDDREGYSGGIFYLVLGSDGRVLANPQQVKVAAMNLGPLPRTTWYSTTAFDGDPTRIYARPLGRRVSPPGAVLVVGQSLEPENSALRSLLLVLLGSGGMGILLSLAGAWFLAGRALIPIQRAFRRQQEFVADASHELRTPMTVLHSASDLLNEHRAESLEANGELFDDIRHEIIRLERLTKDLLTLARSDQGELDLAVAPLDVALLARDVVRRVEPLARGEGIRLSFDAAYAADSAPNVEADPDRLEQSLLILLDNAIKFTAKDGIVEVKVAVENGDAILEVTDTGAGIPAEHLPRILDRFYRVDTARSREQGGTGLGLAIAKTLIDAHGGDLSVSSTVGVGTRVTVRLPGLGSPRSITRRLGALASRFAHTQARE